MTAYPNHRTPTLIGSVLAVGTLLATGQAFAAGGDFANTDFAAAAPFTYNHATGGGAYNDRTTGDFNDITEQLEGGEFSCGDVVTYLAQIQMEGTTVDPVQTAEFDFRFLGNSTGQRGAALIEFVNVGMNYGQVENGDNDTGVNPGVGNFGADSGISDDGGSTATLVSETFVGTAFQSGAELLGTVQVTDLEPGESTVLRIDVRLACDPGTSPTGNLQGQLDAGRVVVGTTGTINTGQQTIPFLKVGEISGAGEPLIAFEKTVTTEMGTCGVDDTESLNAFTGDTVKYCYTVSNPGTAELIGVEIVDDNGTSGDPSDDFTITLGVLGGVSEVTTEYLVTMPDDDVTVTNTATASGNNGRSGGNYQELSASDIASVTLTVAPPNNPPEANDDTYSVDEDGTLTVSVDDGVLVSNDSDIDGDELAVNLVSESSNGTLIQNTDGSFTYTPATDFSGEDSYTYEACDESACDTATVTITVNPVNDAPVADDDYAVTNEGTPVKIAVTGNDSDVDGDALTVTSYTNPANGSVIQNEDGSLTYTPDAGFTGTDSFNYTVCDADGLCDTATVTIEVLQVQADNGPPVAEDDSSATDEDTPVNIDVAVNDSDVDNNLVPGSAVVVAGPENGSLTNNDDGTFSYTPDPDFNGNDSFTYEICDTDDLCDTATVSISVNPVNDAPVAADDSAGTPEDVPVVIDVLKNDSDADGDALSISVTETTNGAVEANGDGTVTYTPDPDFNGQDSFTYEVCDSSLECDYATVTVDVTPVNDAPVAADDSAITDEDTPVNIDVAANDSDVDNNLVPGSAVVVDGPENGSLTNNGDGTFSYTPDPDFNGQDSFTYQICDTDELCDTATVDISVNPVNDPPVAFDDTYSTDEDVALTVSATGVLGNDSDVDGDSLSVTDYTQPANGSVVQNADGSLTYTPDADFNGDDSYTYTVSDGNGGTTTATVGIVVGAINDAPVAADDAYSVDEDTPLTVPSSGILGNDSDVDGDALTVTLLSNPSNGILEQNADGSFAYTPDANFNGADSYTYQACDPTGECGTATVSITVNPVNDPPVAVDDAYSTTQDTTLTVPASGVLGNDSDIDGDLLFVDSHDAVSEFGASVTVDADGMLSYDPAPGFAGIDTFTYTISDGNGGVETANVTVTVEAKNNRSISVDLQDFWFDVNGSLGGYLVITNQSGDYDVQINDLAVEVQYRVPGQKWTYVAVTDGSCSFDPAPRFLVADQEEVGFSGCTLDASIPENATVRVTAKVQINGRIKGKGKVGTDGWFLNRMSM